MNRLLIKSSVLWGIILGVILLITLLAVGNGYANGVITAKYFRFAWTMLVGVLFVCGICCTHFQYHWKVTDLWVILLTLYIGFNYFLTDSFVSVRVLVLGILVGWYFICRISGEKQNNWYIFTYLILIGASIESVWGIFQIYDWVASYHSQYRLTGSFFNPGPYSGYLAVALPISINVLIQSQKTLSQNKLLYILSIITLSLVLVVLPAGMSRAAWVASCCGVIFVLRKNERIGNYWRNWINRFHFKRLYLILAILILVLLVGSNLYLLKKDSADGRMFIWKMSCHVIGQNLWIGVGGGNLSGALGQAQADYFAEGSSSLQEKFVAGSPEYAFNEYIQIWVEYGIIGFLLYIVLLMSLFWPLSLRKNDELTGIVGGMVTFLVFSCFSYPFSILPLSMLFFMLAAAIVNKQKKGNIFFGRWNKLSFIMTMIGVIVCIVFLLFKEQAYRNWEKGKAYAGVNRLQYFAALYPHLQGELGYLFIYAHELIENEEYEVANKVLDKAIRLSSDPLIYTKIGKNYQALKQYDRAEKAYLQAAHRIPHRIYPLYLLALLYREMGDMEKAREMAQKVIDREPKVWSPAVEEMKAEMKQL